MAGIDLRAAHELCMTDDNIDIHRWPVIRSSDIVYSDALCSGRWWVTVRHSSLLCVCGTGGCQVHIYGLYLTKQLQQSQVVFYAVHRSVDLVAELPFVCRKCPVQTQTVQWLVLEFGEMCPGLHGSGVWNRPPRISSQYPVLKFCEFCELVVIDTCWLLSDFCKSLAMDPDAAHIMVHWKCSTWNGEMCCLDLDKRLLVSFILSKVALQSYVIVPLVVSFWTSGRSPPKWEERVWAAVTLLLVDGVL